MKFSFESLLNAGGSRLTYGLLNLRIFAWILYGFTRPGILVPSQILSQVIRIGVQAVPMAKYTPRLLGPTICYGVVLRYHFSLLG